MLRHRKVKDAASSAHVLSSAMLSCTVTIDAKHRGTRSNALAALFVRTSACIAYKLLSYLLPFLLWK